MEEQDTVSVYIRISRPALSLGFLHRQEPSTINRTAQPLTTVHRPLQLSKRSRRIDLQSSTNPPINMPFNSKTSSSNAALPAYTQTYTASNDTTNQQRQHRDQLPAYAEATRGSSPVNLFDEKQAGGEKKKSKFSAVKNALKNIPLDPEPSSSSKGSLGESQQVEKAVAKNACI